MIFLLYKKLFKKVIDKLSQKRYTILASSIRNADGILAQLGEHLPYKQRVTGSSPVGPINQKWLCRRGGTGRRTGLKILRD